MRKQKQNKNAGTIQGSTVQGIQTDRLLAESLDKIIAIYYNDTLNSVSFKVGTFLDFDQFNLKILENGNRTPTIIPRQKCIRIELGGKENVTYSRTR